MNVKIKLQKVSAFNTKLVLKVSAFPALRKAPLFGSVLSKNNFAGLFYAETCAVGVIFKEISGGKNYIKNVKHSHRHTSFYRTL